MRRWLITGVAALALIAGSSIAIRAAPAGARFLNPLQPWAAGDVHLLRPLAAT